MSNLSDVKKALANAEVALAQVAKREANMIKKHDRYVAELVHDIKNPLAAMMGFLTLLKSQVHGPIANKEYMHYIETLDMASRRLLGICNSLLGGGSENQANGGAAAEDNITDVTATIDEVHALFKAQAAERGIKLHTEISDNFPNLKTPPEELYRVLMNIVSNALKFTPRDGNVTIKTEVDPTNNTIIMVVRDSGVGMSQEQIKAITTDNKSTISPHGDQGTGHGLRIVHEIVNNLGGHLGISSTENRGTRIRITFPPSLSAPIPIMPKSELPPPLPPAE